MANTGRAAPLPEPAYVQKIILQGITGVPPRALAIINGKTLAVSESATIKVDSHSVSIRCLEITRNSATISIQGVGNPKRLTLR